MQNGPIIYFDGVCNLCERSVQFILRIDHKKIFRFASLQGKAGQAMLDANRLPHHDLKSFVVQEGEKIYTKSTGALRVLKHIGGPWSLLYMFIIVPPFIRDGVYAFVSRNRYKWFGEKNSCWLPTPDLQQRFLD
jgi:predicted DCC family thiol-disulfide oxidoreductase YuxK